MGKLPILQSGFISNTEAGLQLFKEQPKGLGTKILDKEYLSANNNNFYSPEVTKLYTAYKFTVVEKHSQETIESIIVTAINAFNTNSMRDWIMLQNEHANLTPLHVQFMNDTMKYVRYGKRSMNVMAWINLIELSRRVDNKSKLPIGSYFTDVTNERLVLDENNLALPNSFEEFLHFWLVQDAGYVDILTTLAVIFGCRSAVTTVYE